MVRSVQGMPNVGQAINENKQGPFEHEGLKRVRQPMQPNETRNPNQEDKNIPLSRQSKRTTETQTNSNIAHNDKDHNKKYPVQKADFGQMFTGDDSLIVNDEATSPQYKTIDPYNDKNIQADPLDIISQVKGRQPF